MSDSADAWMGTAVAAQVDQLAGAGDAGEERLNEAGVGADQREHRAMVVGRRSGRRGLSPAPPSVSSIAATTAASCPSETFGTDSSGSSMTRV